MPVRDRTSVSIRSMSAALALAFVAGACSNADVADAPPVSAAAPGQPAGSVLLPAGTDPAQIVQRLQDAITAGGGSVAAVVDHAAGARAAGVEIPSNIVVIGGAPAAQVPLVRADQRAAANLPQRYQVRQGGDGSVSLFYDGADYVAAVSGVVVPEARPALRDASAAVAGQAVPGVTPPPPAALLGVTPANYLLTVFGSADVPVTVERLRRNADRGASRSVGIVDMAAGSADPGPAVRPTSVVLVSTPPAEAPLLAAAPSFGLDLPMRFVVWIDDQNRTQIGYPDVRRLAARHGVRADDPNIVRLAADADRLARLAAGLIQ
jgi:uncharacterized protein (DUF302 family)